VYITGQGRDVAEKIKRSLNRRTVVEPADPTKHYEPLL
jgi:hypothetical protein